MTILKRTTKIESKDESDRVYYTVQLTLTLHTEIGRIGGRIGFTSWECDRLPGISLCGNHLSKEGMEEVVEAAEKLYFGSGSGGLLAAFNALWTKMEQEINRLANRQPNWLNGVESGNESGGRLPQPNKGEHR